MSSFLERTSPQWMAQGQGGEEHEGVERSASSRLPGLPPPAHVLPGLPSSPMSKSGFRVEPSVFCFLGARVMWQKTLETGKLEGQSRPS